MLKTTPVFSRLLLHIYPFTVRTLFHMRAVYSADFTMAPSATRGKYGGNHIHKIIPNRSPKQNLRRFREFDLQGKVFAITGRGKDLGLTLEEAPVEAGDQGIWNIKEMMAKLVSPTQCSASTA
jgi:hypothetical protein